MNDKKHALTKIEEQQIIDEVEKRVLEKLNKSIIREDTQKVLRGPRNKWFRDADALGAKSLMTEVLGDTYIAWSAWEQIRRLTCIACGKKYVRQLTEDDRAEEACERICQLIYDIAVERKEIMK